MGFFKDYDGVLHRVSSVLSIRIEEALSSDTENVYMVTLEGSGLYTYVDEETQQQIVGEGDTADEAGETFVPAQANFYLVVDINKSLSVGNLAPIAAWRFKNGALSPITVAGWTIPANSFTPYLIYDANSKKLWADGFTQSFDTISSWHKEQYSEWT